MELPVSLQGAQFAGAFALGLALAACYDIFRAVRRAHPRLTRPLDALYCLLLLLSLLLYALYPGRGEFRVFFYPGIFLGALLWFLTVSTPFLRALRAIGRLIDKIWAFLTAPLRAFRKIIEKFLKYLFSSAGKSVKIGVEAFRAMRARSRERRTGNEAEAEKIVADGQTDRSEPGGVFCHYACVTPVPDPGPSSRSRRTSRTRRKRAAGDGAPEERD